MDFNEYDENCRHTDVGTSEKDCLKPGWLYYVLGIGGESGEILEKVKKLFRDKNGVIDDEFKIMILKECGDVLWYISRLLEQFDLSLEECAIANSEKLIDRMRREVLHGDGDER
jgi:NTP pyrophosphatase (non-canonical NTP hydrolase)